VLEKLEVLDKVGSGVRTAVLNGVNESFHQEKRRQDHVECYFEYGNFLRKSSLPRPREDGRCSSSTQVCQSVVLW
jgi:hypothetical protein